MTPDTPDDMVVNSPNESAINNAAGFWFNEHESRQHYG